MKDIETDASLALDGHKIILNAVGIHELGHIGAHMTTKQAGCHNIVAQLTKDAGYVKALAAGGLFGRHTVYVVNDELIELIARIDGRVHRNGEDHF